MSNLFLGNICCLLTSYLFGRLFRVAHGDAKSSFYATQTRVPQGSIFGPFLCLLYTIDLQLDDRTPTATFADDATIISISDSNAGANFNLQRTVWLHGVPVGALNWKKINHNTYVLRWNIRTRRIKYILALRLFHNMWFSWIFRDVSRFSNFMEDPCKYEVRVNEENFFRIILDFRMELYTRCIS